MAYNSWSLPNRGLNHSTREFLYSFISSGHESVIFCLSLYLESSGLNAQSSDEQIFNSLNPINGLLSGKQSTSVTISVRYYNYNISGGQARPVFEQSRLPADQLAQVWSRVDRNSDGFINKQEFCQAMSLIRQINGSSSVSTVSNQYEYNY